MKSLFLMFASLVFLDLTLIQLSTANAAGLEKSILWSGRYAGTAGAATSIVTGAESLFFNPAGLGGTQGLQANLNFSPTFSQFSAPNRAGGTSNSNLGFSPVIAGFVSYGINSKLGVGLGYYISGGNKADYQNFDFGTGFSNLKPSLKSEISIAELSSGLGYEFIDGLRLGLAYRIVFVNANLALASLANLPTPTLIATSFDSLSGVRYNGFRAGIQYAPKESRWGLGAQWRTEIAFSTNGTVSGSLLAAGGASATSVSGSPAVVSGIFPQQVSLGGYFDIFPNQWRVLADYVFTEYSRNQHLNIVGALGNIPLSSFTLNWTNMSNLKIATEYKGIANWPIRVGYIYTSQVTPTANANPTFSSPGSGHTLAAGTGTNLMSLLDLDFALEYSFASGSASSTDGPIPGTYSTSAYAGHLGLTYRLDSL